MSVRDADKSDAPKPAAELFLDNGVSDEAPTIISKSIPAPARSDTSRNRVPRFRSSWFFWR